jgi:hypothetical protein
MHCKYYVFVICVDIYAQSIAAFELCMVIFLWYNPGLNGRHLSGFMRPSYVKYELSITFISRLCVEYLLLCIDRLSGTIGW